MSNSLNDRITKAKETVANLEKQRRVERRREREELRKKNDRRNYILGRLVSKHLPEVLQLVPHRKNEDNNVEFKPFEEFLTELAKDGELVEMLRKAITNREQSR